MPVGPADIDRLRQLFALEPRLDRGSLKSMLSALLVKTPAQREVFEALFAGWCPDHAADWPEEELATPTRVQPRSRHQTPRCSSHPPGTPENNHTDTCHRRCSPQCSSWSSARC